MAGHAIGDPAVLTGTIVEIDGDIAVVKVDQAFPSGGTVTVRLAEPPSDDGETEEDWIRAAMVAAMEHPGREVTR